jgi:hypothetical protein
MLNSRLIASFAFVSALLATGLAQSQDWGGFYVDGELGARGSSADVSSASRESYSSSGSGPGWSWTSSDVYTSSEDGNMSAINFLAQFSGGWRFANPSVVVGIGAFFDLAEDGAGENNSPSRLPLGPLLQRLLSTAVATPTSNSTNSSRKTDTASA